MIKIFSLYYVMLVTINNKNDQVSQRTAVSITYIVLLYIDKDNDIMGKFR